MRRNRVIVGLSKDNTIMRQTLQKIIDGTVKQKAKAPKGVGSSP